MVTGVASAVLCAAGSGLAGWLLGDTTGLLVLGGIGLLLGVVYGAGVARSGCYAMRGGRGPAAFVADHTWSLPNTLIGGLFLGICWLAGNRVDPAFSQKFNHIGLQNRLVSSYATTIGPVLAGTGLVDRHEAVHVLQARLFGPLYLPLVVANYVVATVLPYWLPVRGRKPVTGLVTYFTHGVYPHVWNEAWAYRVEGSPP